MDKPSFLRGRGRGRGRGGGDAYQPGSQGMATKDMGISNPIGYGRSGRGNKISNSKSSNGFTHKMKENGTHGGAHQGINKRLYVVEHDKMVPNSYLQIIISVYI